MIDNKYKLIIYSCCFNIRYFRLVSSLFPHVMTILSYSLNACFNTRLTLTAVSTNNAQIHSVSYKQKAPRVERNPFKQVQLSEESISIEKNTFPLGHNLLVFWRV